MNTSVLFDEPGLKKAPARPAHTPCPGAWKASKVGLIPCHVLPWLGAAPWRERQSIALSSGMGQLRDAHGPMPLRPLEPGLACQVTERMMDDTDCSVLQQGPHYVRQIGLSKEESDAKACGKCATSSWTWYLAKTPYPQSPDPLRLCAWQIRHIVRAILHLLYTELARLLPCPAQALTSTWEGGESGTSPTARPTASAESAGS